ncbi:MAG: phosphoglycerate kinase [Candidatus Dojkabacteria bacterium]|nr:phosphoglycerate kinase [Candidatus Dojkabacteria bacterium]
MNNKYLHLDRVYYKTIENVCNKKVIIRACLNVEIDKEYNIVNDSRLQQAFPLINEMVNVAQSVLVIGHIGRPKTRDPRLSIKQIIPFFKNKFKNTSIRIKVLDDIDQDSFTKIKMYSKNKTVFFLENIRFFSEEESEDIRVQENFAMKLAKLGDIFINDAFPDYRISASTYYIARYLPSYIGPAYKNEVDKLNLIFNPNKPFVAIMGGAKLSEKIDILNLMLKISDKVLIGGAMSYTFLKAIGIQIGSSLFEPEKLELAKSMIENYKHKICLPIDHVIVKSLDILSNIEITKNSAIPDDYVGVDIGPNTIKLFESEILHASTILWNGPMGMFENTSFANGTKNIAMLLSHLKNKVIIAGGGETVQAINKFCENKNGYTHISNGGGAMLFYISNENFPTLDVILEKHN